MRAFIRTSILVIRSFMATIKERLTEGGASGAFFFFTKDETFIAKSCTVEEFIHIRKSASILANYFEENPHSFITKVRHLLHSNFSSCLSSLNISMPLHIHVSQTIPFMYCRFTAYIVWSFTGQFYIFSSQTTYSSIPTMKSSTRSMI